MMNRSTFPQTAKHMKCTILAVCARALTYPDTPGFAEQLRECRNALQNERGEGLEELQAAVDEMLSRDVLDLAEEYVNTFDLSDQTTLHLTAHEHGDSRDRGPALLHLAQMYRMAGCQQNDEQLADFLPSLLELLAIAIDEQVDSELVAELESRVSQVCRKICGQLTASVYLPVFQVLVHTLDEPLPAPIVTAASGDDEDPEDMPYPLHYE